LTRGGVQNERPRMSDSSDERSRRLDARDNRRWLIGVGISVAFGLFGVVMALLSYAHRTSPATPRAAAAPAPAARAPASKAPDERERDGRRHRK
jgi:hypothetical protein